MLMSLSLSLLLSQSPHHFHKFLIFQLTHRVTPMFEASLRSTVTALTQALLFIHSVYWPVNDSCYLCEQRQMDAGPPCWDEGKYH